MKRSAGFLFMAACLVLGSAGYAQDKKTAKQAESLEKAGEDAKQAVDDVLAHVVKMLEGYNEIIDGSAKNPQSAYKKLAGDLKSSDKMLKDATKKLESMEKEAGKFFAAWEADLQSFSSDSMKEKSQKRLDASKAKYEELGAALREAGQAFDPLVANLSDQILYLGRDLSPEAIADLQDEAAALNEQAKEVADTINGLMEKTGEVENPMEG